MVQATSTEFHMCTTLLSYFQEHQLYKNQAGKSPTILDFLLGVDFIRRVPTGVGGGGRRPEAGKVMILNF